MFWISTRHREVPKDGNVYLGLSEELLCLLFWDTEKNDYQYTGFSENLIWCPEAITHWCPIEYPDDY